MVVTSAGAAKGKTRTVSVAIATYRGERFLLPQLESIAAQTRLPDELVVCDDGSTDGTIAILERFATTAPFPVTIFQHPKNVGVLENFYSAFARTTGDIIFYCDQDDVWAPDKVKRVLAAFDDPEVRVCAHRSLVVDEDLEPREVIPNNSRYGKIDFPVDVTSTHAFGHQMAFDRDVLALMVKLQPDLAAMAPGDMSNNFDPFIPFCGSMIGAIHLLPDPLIRFRRHGGTVSPLAKEDAVSLSRLQRLAATAQLVLQRIRNRAGLIERADALGLLPADRVAVLRAAYGRRIAVGEAASNARSGSLPARLVRAVRAAIETLRPRQGFSNDRRIRELALAAASAAVGPVDKITG
jgi:glycosyltransferase involved in cell wall biosynthesis